jgi:starch phosphorylase
MIVTGAQAPSVLYHGHAYLFCSEFCKRAFAAAPEKYVGESRHPVPTGSAVARRIAYFSMEVAADPRMPTYSGGLGVLAGDTLRSCADLKIPVVAVSLVHRKGYFEQTLDRWGHQRERPSHWDPSGLSRLMPPAVHVLIEGRSVVVRAWQHDVIGTTGYVVPLLLLDTDVEANSQSDRELTAYLYGGDERYRLAQEVLLGVGGLRMLRALGYTQLERFHLNEGHASLLELELLRESQNPSTQEWDFERVRARCVFTTHTPVPAGHDQFSYELIRYMTRLQGALRPIHPGLDHGPLCAVLRNQHSQLSDLAGTHGGEGPFAGGGHPPYGGILEARCPDHRRGASGDVVQAA